MRKIEFDNVEENFFKYLMSCGNGESFNRGIVNRLHLIRQHFTDSEIIACSDADKLIISSIGENTYNNLSRWSKKVYRKAVNDFIKFSKELDFYNSTNL